jgi:hypothetical protein
MIKLWVRLHGENAVRVGPQLIRCPLTRAVVPH